MDIMYRDFSEISDPAMDVLHKSSTDIPLFLPNQEEEELFDEELLDNPDQVEDKIDPNVQLEDDYQFGQGGLANETPEQDPSLEIIPESDNENERSHRGTNQKEDVDEVMVTESDYEEEMMNFTDEMYEQRDSRGSS